ncbi:MAG: hypothetical protein JW806_00075 [Sedimentisphaerales bacterium]|nr:hypothetical protein [Sedimentisphaerales bacterium]
MKKDCQKINACINTSATVVMAVTAIIMLGTVCQNSEALKLTRKDFELRNRPWVTIGNYRFGEEIVDSNGTPIPHSVIFQLANVSQFPANYKLISKLILDDIVIRQEESSWLAPEGNAGIIRGITEDLYSKATDKQYKFKIFTRIYYRGILDNDPNKYETLDCVYFSTDDNKFSQESGCPTYK